MFRDGARIVLGTADEGGLPSTQDRKPDRVHPGCTDHPADVLEMALVVDHRDVPPVRRGTSKGILAWENPSHSTMPR